MKRIFLLTLLFVIVIGYSAEAQRKSSKKRKGKVKTAIVTTDDGSQLRGEIRKLTKDSLVIETEQFGILRYHRDDVEYVIDSRGTKAIKTNGNKYMLSPSALPVEETYMEFAWLVPTVGFRINDYLSASVTLEPFSTVFLRYPTLFGSVKGSMRLGHKWHGAIGLNIGTFQALRSDGFVLLSPFVTFTRGDVKNHFSASLRMVTGALEVETAYDLSFAGNKRVSRRLSLVGEVHVLGGGEYGQFGMLGLRKHPSSGETTYDVGIMVFSGGIPIPYIGFSFPIN